MSFYLKRSLTEVRNQFWTGNRNEKKKEDRKGITGTSERNAHHYV